MIIETSAEFESIPRWVMHMQSYQFGASIPLELYLLQLINHFHSFNTQVLPIFDPDHARSSHSITPDISPSGGPTVNLLLTQPT